MFNKKLSIRTQQEEVAELTSFGDKVFFKSILQIILLVIH